MTKGSPAAQPGDDTDPAGLVDSSVEETRLALGRRIRNLRQASGLNGRSLAEALGVTSGFVSQIETGIATPSVANLVKIARTLGVKVGDLFEADAPSGVVIRAGDRVGFAYPSLGLAEQLLYEDRRCEISVLVMQPGCESGPELYTMSYELEFVFVLRGEYEALVGDESYVLGPGDALHFAGSAPHGFRCSSPTGAEVLVASLLPGTSSLTALASSKRVRQSGGVPITGEPSHPNAQEPPVAG